MAILFGSKTRNSANVWNEQPDHPIQNGLEDYEKILFTEYGMDGENPEEEDLFPDWGSDNEDVYEEDEFDDRLGFFKQYLDEEIFLDKHFGDQPCSVYKRINIVDNTYLAILDETLDTILKNISVKEESVIRKYFGFNPECIAYDTETIARQLDLSEEDVINLKADGLDILRASQDLLTDKSIYQDQQAFHQAINKVIDEKFYKLDQSIINDYMEDNLPYFPLLLSLIEAEDNPFNHIIDIEIVDEWAIIQKLHDLDEDDNYDIVTKAKRSRNLINSMLGYTGLSIYEKLILLHSQYDVDNCLVKGLNDKTICIEEGPLLKEFWDKVVKPVGDIADDQIDAFIQEGIFVNNDDKDDYKNPPKPVIKTLCDQVRDELNACHNSKNIIGQYVCYDWFNDDYFLPYETESCFPYLEERVATRHKDSSDSILNFIDEYKRQQFSRLPEAIKEVELSFIDLIVDDVEEMLSDFGKGSENNAVIEEIIRKLFEINEDYEFTGVEGIAKEVNQPSDTIWSLCRQGLYQLRHQTINPVRDNKHYREYLDWLERLNELIIEGFEYAQEFEEDYS